MITPFTCECGWKSALCEHAGDAFENTKKEIAQLKAEIVNREGEKLEMREVIDRLKAENEKLKEIANAVCEFIETKDYQSKLILENFAADRKRLLNVSQESRNSDRSKERVDDDNMLGGSDEVNNES